MSLPRGPDSDSAATGAGPSTPQPSEAVKILFREVCTEHNDNDRRVGDERCWKNECRECVDLAFAAVRAEAAAAGAGDAAKELAYLAEVVFQNRRSDDLHDAWLWFANRHPEQAQAIRARGEAKT